VSHLHILTEILILKNNSNDNPNLLCSNFIGSKFGLSFFSHFSILKFHKYVKTFFLNSYFYLSKSIFVFWFFFIEMIFLNKTLFYFCCNNTSNFIEIMILFAINDYEIIFFLKLMLFFFLNNIIFTFWFFLEKI